MYECRGRRKIDWFPRDTVCGHNFHHFFHTWPYRSIRIARPIDIRNFGQVWKKWLVTLT
jgi:hypothetical protein